MAAAMPTNHSNANAADGGVNGPGARRKVASSRNGSRPAVSAIATSSKR